MPTFPVGVETCQIIYGKGISPTGNAQKAQLQVDLILGGSAQAVVWEGDGTPLLKLVDTFTSAAGETGAAIVPVVDQAGWLDGAGDAFSMWAYRLTERVGNVTRVKYVQPVAGQTSIDFDMIPDGNVGLPISAPVVPVTSVNGLTGAVTVEGATNAGVAGFIAEEGPTKDELSATFVGIPEGIGDGEVPTWDATAETWIPGTGGGAGGGDYPPPGGVPLDALEESVQDSLALADTSVQPADLASITGGITVTAISGESNASAVARINAALVTAMPVGGHRVVKLVGDFTIDTPIIIPSNTTLDASGASITGGTVASGARRNLIENVATSTVQRTMTVDMTAGSAVVTATAGTFTAGDVGRTIIIPDAGGLGQAANYGPTVGKIITYTSGTQVTIDHAAYNNVTGKTARVYDRDSNINVIGGRWNRGPTATTTGNPWNVHSIVFRRVDGLRLDRMHAEANHGKYLFHIADVTWGWITNVRLDNTSSDGIHFNGPLSHISVTDIKGSTHDDTVAFTARDWDSYNDSQGNVSDILVDGVDGDGGTSALLKIIGGRGVTLRRISAINFKGYKACGASIKDDGVGATDISDITLENWNVLLSSSARPGIETGVTDGKSITIKSFYYDGPTGSNLLRQTGGEWDAITLDDVGMSAPIDNSRSLWIEGTVGKLKASRVTHRGIGVTTGSSLLYASSSNTVIGSAQFSDISMENGDTFIHSAASSTVTKVQVNGFEASGCRRIVTVASNIDLTLLGFGGSLAAQALRIESSMTLILRGAGVRNDNAFSPISLASGGVLQCFNPDWAMAVSSAAPVAGGKAYNTSAGLACGVGAVISDGTSWKNLYTAAVYTP